MEQQIIELLTLIGIGPTLASVIAVIVVACITIAKNKKSNATVQYSLTENARNIAESLERNAQKLKEQVDKSSLEKEALRLNQELLRKNIELQAEIKRLRKQLLKINEE